MIMDDERRERGSRNVKNADCGSGGINISDNLEDQTSVASIWIYLMVYLTLHENPNLHSGVMREALSPLMPFVVFYYKILTIS